MVSLNSVCYLLFLIILPDEHLNLHRAWNTFSYVHLGLHGTEFGWACIYNVVTRGSLVGINDFNMFLECLDLADF